MTQYCNSVQAAYREDTESFAERAPDRAGWHVLWTRSNCEQLVRDQLLARGYEAFLPMIAEWSGGSRRRQGAPVRPAPMFKGYLFLRHQIDKETYLEVSNTKGVVQILGSHWNRLAQVPDAEIDTIRRAVGAQLPLQPYPYLRNGSRVRITRGPLANTEGVLVMTDYAKGLFVVSVHLLQRSIAIQVDCSDVTPV